MKKTIKAWAVISPGKVFHYWTVSMTRKDVIEKINHNYSRHWPFHRKKFGYRIRRITVTVED